MPPKKPDASIKTLDGRVYCVSQRTKFFGAEEYEECLRILGAEVDNELSERTTDLVTAEGTLSKTAQKKVDSLTKKGASIRVLSVSELHDDLKLPASLVGQLLQGTSSDHDDLYSLGRAYRMDMDKLAAESVDLAGRTFGSNVLAYVQLREVDLSNAGLKSKSLYRLERCKVDGADLSGSRIRNATDSSLRGVKVQDGRLNGGFAGSSFEGADLRGCTLNLRADSSRPSEPPVFRSADLEGAKIDGIGWEDIDFAGSSAVGTRWKSLEAQRGLFSGVDFSKCIMNLSLIHI